MPDSAKILIVGAGVFGGWTALQLHRSGYNVTLTDCFGPGNSLSSSGGESRLIRAVYGNSKKYFDMTIKAYQSWRELEQLSGQTILYNTGVLWLLHKNSYDIRKAIRSIMDERNWPYEILSESDIGELYPMIAQDDIESILVEKKAGYLHARYACKLVCEQFQKEGGEYFQAVIKPGKIESGRMIGVECNGIRTKYDNVVFACGPWLKELFPELLGSKLTVTRQEVHYFGIPAEKVALFSSLPPWVDWDPEAIFYGIPGQDHHGFKVACDVRGEISDPSLMDRRPQSSWVEWSKEFLSKRFPDLTSSPVIETRVCQYTNTIDGNFILDMHPEAENVWLLGGGSGHGFKHGPAFGKLASEIISGEKSLDPDFVLPI